MEKSLVLGFILLLLEATMATVSFRQCCPEDEEHVFIRRNSTCIASSTLGLGCKNDSDVNSLLKERHDYWIRESDGSAVMGSDVFGVILSRDSFCVANIAYKMNSKNDSNETVFHYSEGIIFCDEAEFYATYLGPEPMSYAVCILISGIGCFLTFLTYIVVPALRRDLLNKCLICALLCFAFSYLTFGINLLQAHRLPHRLCAYQLLFTMFWITAAVFWTNAISFDIWRSVTFRRFPLNEARLLKVYYFWGWGMPLLLSLTGIILELIAGEGYAYGCYVDSEMSLIMHVFPCLLLFFFNLLYFIWAICRLWRQEGPNSAGLKVTRLQRLRYKCSLYLKLFLVMGIPWIVRFVTLFLPGNTFTRILLNTLTVLQGLFVFLLLVVFRKKALLGLAEQFAKWGCPCPFVTTNFAVTLHEEGNDSDDDSSEAQRDTVELNPQQTNTAS